MRFPTMSVSIAGGCTGATESINLGETFSNASFQAASINQGIIEVGAVFIQI